VRLAGLYALEHLAQDNPGHRQTIVNVICAYLRMPYTPHSSDDEPGRQAQRYHQRRYQAARRGQPAPTPPDTGKPTEGHEEREVRLTAQHILTTYLQPTPATPTTTTASRFWDNI
jgi:hypothetical protein